MTDESLAGELPRHALRELVDRALAEDLASGDLTTECCVAPDLNARARAVARHPLVVCGGQVFIRVFAQVDPRCVVEILHPDGAFIEGDAVLWDVRGPARSLLSAERVALNFTQRMCGIATMARRYQGAVAEGGTTRVTDYELVKGNGVYENGRWHVVITRAMKVQSSEKLAEFEPGKAGGFAVAIWEGGQGERAGLKAISGDDWLKLDIEAASAVKA